MYYEYEINRYDCSVEVWSYFKA